VWKFSLWRHGDEEGVKREHVLETLVGMLDGLIAADPKVDKARALHRHRVPGPDRGGRLHRARRREPARQLGEQPVQPAAQAARRHPQDRG
jgi:hypothetical protein